VADNIRLSFPREPDSVPAARAALDGFEGEVAAAALYDASLCLSELVTNAIQHPDADADEELHLELRLTDASLRVQVVDPGSGFRPGKPTEGDDRGWGLFIVDQLASRWGTEPGDRTVMWFEIDRRAGAARAGSERLADPAGETDDDPRRDQVANAVARLRLRPLVD
jgi:anti-sigma regulatory factor (Ser/Thr protein kinase)